MSQVSITLRTTEEDNFVVGYPGIPSCASRPQASVRGIAKLGVLPDAMNKIEAKWVRVELKKVETVMHNGVSRSFEECVGARYTTLWSASDTKGYGLLVTQDFPFSIRLPESIPPTIEIQDGVGIRYELVASTCIKGKGGMLRRTKPVILRTSTPVTIQKHELHSTWTAYNMPEKYETCKKGFTFTVQRNQRCFGPGDRITATTTLTPDFSALQTNAVLQDFEMSLKQFITLNIPNTSATSHRKETVISCNNIVMNVGVEPDKRFVSEVTCVVPPDHTMATLNALSSRHINITYSLCIKAVLNKTSISLEYPVIISNIERHDSVRLVNRIGVVPVLSALSAFRSTPPEVTEVDRYSIRRSYHSDERQSTIIVPSRQTTEEQLQMCHLQAGDGAASPRPSSQLSHIPNLPINHPSLFRSSTETNTSRFQVVGPRPLPRPPTGIYRPRFSLPAPSPLQVPVRAELQRRTWPGSAFRDPHVDTRLGWTMPVSVYDSLPFLSTSQPVVHIELESKAPSESPHFIGIPSAELSSLSILQEAELTLSPIGRTHDDRRESQDLSIGPDERAYQGRVPTPILTRSPMNQSFNSLLPRTHPLASLNGDIKDPQIRCPTSIQVLSVTENQPAPVENGDIPYARMSGYECSTDGDDIYYARMSGYQCSTDGEDIYYDPSPEYTSSDNLNGPQTRSTSPQSVSSTDLTSTSYAPSSFNSLSTNQRTSLSSYPMNEKLDSSSWSCSSGYEASYSSTSTNAVSIYDPSESNVTLHAYSSRRGMNSLRDNSQFRRYIRSPVDAMLPQAWNGSYDTRHSTMTQGVCQTADSDADDSDDDENEESPPDYFTSVIMSYYFSHQASRPN